MTASSAALGPRLDSWLEFTLASYVEDICGLVRLPTVTPAEEPALAWLRTYFGQRARTRLEPAHPDLARHPDANHNAYLGRPDRGAVSVDWPGTVAGPRLLFSAHVDVVPAGSGFPDAFEPRRDGERLIGRGTTDTKGNIVMLAAALDFVRDHDLPHPPVTLDLVVEEEIGGNGALSTLLHGRQADAVVVLEPTGLEVFHGHRGCLEFTATVTGRASHMGGSGVSAILGAADLITELRALERRMIAEAAADPAFRGYARPVQVNIGTIAGGEWHGSLAEQCTVGGSFGFHPDLDVAVVRDLLESLPIRLDEAWLRGHIAFSYNGIHNGAYLGDPDSWLAESLRVGVQVTGTAVEERRAWCVSCDARLYHDVLDAPVVVFGAGRLDQAHSSTEYLDLGEWRHGVHALMRLLTQEDRWPAA